MMIVYYLIAVIAACYGLKCILLQGGTLLALRPGRLFRHVWRLVPVHGAPAVTAGWSYLCGAWFWALRPVNRGPDDSLLWYIVRAVFSWSGFVLMFWLLYIAGRQRFGR